MTSGADRALIVALNASRYNYMTRISNGFQLKLERENVFYDYYNTKPQRDDAASETRPRGNPVALLTDEECWKRMPTPASGSGRPLPNWAKAVAVSLPRTAAAMLDLDHAQRKRGPLDPVLRAKMRWVVAHANRCAYSEAYALADLRRAGGDEAGGQDPDRRSVGLAGERPRPARIRPAPHRRGPDDQGRILRPASAIATAISGSRPWCCWRPTATSRTASSSGLNLPVEDGRPAAAARGQVRARGIPVRAAPPPRVESSPAALVGRNGRRSRP